MTLTRDRQTERAQRRIAAFEAQWLGDYGEQVLDLACHAAFPLTLTTDLIYCLREAFVPQCPWYGAPDILLSGLCSSVGYDLYEMPGAIRPLLLKRLLSRLSTDAEKEHYLDRLADFMGEYIQHRRALEQSDRPLNLGEPGTLHWTALALLKPGDLYDRLCADLRELLKQKNVNDYLRLSSVVESYDDWLPADLRDRYRLIDLADLVADGNLDPPPPGMTLEEFDYRIVTLHFDDDPPDGMEAYDFETVTVNHSGIVTNQENYRAFYFIESLGDIDLEMVAIPSGIFPMGSTANDSKASDREIPQHSVTVPPFFISKTQITQAQWRFVAGLAVVNRKLDPNPSKFRYDDRPVEQVSWHEAVEFCARLSRHTGRTYRLPSEAEWEYACKSGTTTPFHFGETLTGDLANYKGDEQYAGETKSRYRKQTVAVKSFLPNSFGIHEMHGNVREWCGDLWHKTYEDAPNTASVWIKNYDRQAYVLRGGSWFNAPQDCRSASRAFGEPDLKSELVGFRIALR